MKKFVKEIKSLKSSYTDQMSEVTPCVKIDNMKIDVTEAFLGFFILKGKQPPDLNDDIFGKLKKHGLNNISVVPKVIIIQLI